jgi:DNA processing protein
MNLLDLHGADFTESAVSPLRELGAYEALWNSTAASFKSLAKKFASYPDSVPSDFIEPSIADKYAQQVRELLAERGVTRFGVRVFGAGEYPAGLRDAEFPIALLYYQGWWELVNSPHSVAVVGTRNPSDEGIKRARRLVRALVADHVTVVSGMAKGIDTVAHKTAIEEGGKTIAVLGTPISHVYPKENSDLQALIARDHLVISQVPVTRYSGNGNPVANRFFFPERNVTMSALTQATVIVEAGETSGTLVQAKAALRQGRKLYILDSCFRDSRLKWPHEMQELGAIRVEDYDDIRRSLFSQKIH